jgi:DNA mismatch repair protein MutS2
VRIYPVAQRATLELDLRGRRAEEIEPLLDRYLSDAALDNLKEVRIIHGFGTGVVRSIVREIAAQHPLVRAFKSTAATEGGDGATLIQLK